MESYGATEFSTDVWKIHGYYMGGWASIIYGEDMGLNLLGCKFPGSISLRIKQGLTHLAEFVIISREGI